MDVSVLHKHAQRSPRPSLLVRLLGAGMLERARATSLALLGATAAVGLAIVALALNQGWPLLEGSAIPAAPRQDVGRASVVARPAPAVLARIPPPPPTRPGRRAGRSRRWERRGASPCGGRNALGRRGSGRARRLRAGAGEVPRGRAEAESSRPRTARRPPALRSRPSLPLTSRPRPPPLRRRRSRRQRPPPLQRPPSRKRSPRKPRRKNRTSPRGAMATATPTGATKAGTTMDMAATTTAGTTATTRTVTGHGD